jgi:malate dehydrogenase
VRDWFLGTPEGDWTSMAIPSPGGLYGVREGLVYSFPVTCAGGEYTIVEGLGLDDFARERMRATEDELVEERAAIAHLLGT